MDLIIFDADGTLFDSVYFYVETYHYLYEKYGVNVSRAHIHRYIGMGADKAIPRLTSDVWAKQYGRSIINEGRDYYIKTFLEKVQLFPGTIDFLRALKADGKKIALATMSCRAVVEHYIDLLGDDAMFDCVTTSTDVAHSKPDPDIFMNVMAHFPDIARNRICVVGDSVWDMQAAQQAGLESVGVLLGGYAREELESAGAWCVQPDIRTFFDDYRERGDGVFSCRVR